MDSSESAVGYPTLRRGLKHLVKACGKVVAAPDRFGAGSLFVSLVEVVFVSAAAVFAQIENVRPEAPEFVTDWVDGLVDKLSPLWWLILLAAVIVFGIGLAAFNGLIRLQRHSWMAPMLFGSPVVAFVMLWVLF